MTTPAEKHSCCDLHGRNCEPPSELCCADCTEAVHPTHWDGSACSNPDLSGTGVEAATPTPADELRVAAALIRGHAEKALAESREAVGGEEWFDPYDLRSGLEDDYGPCKATAEHIATWSPTAALAVAALLEVLADVASYAAERGYANAADGQVAAALAVARAIGGQP